MMKFTSLLAGAYFMLGWTPHAGAASSAVFDTEGGSIRLVTSGAPDAGGKLRGILDIRLKPGWKTYWRDPGDAGVPPQLDVTGSTNVASVDIFYPAPGHHDDGYSIWAGYDQPVAFPIVFTVQDAGNPTAINASVFIGICRSICIPVQAQLTVDPAQGADDPADAFAVQSAFNALPKPADASFGVEAQSATPDAILVKAMLPDGSNDADFFLAASDGYAFGAPKRGDREGMIMFSVPILDRPASKPIGLPGLSYTLVSGSDAVSGVLPFP